MNAYEPNTLGVARTPQGEYICRIQFVSNRFIYARRCDNDALLCIHDSYFMPTPAIPSRLRKYAFEAVAHIWGEALRKYPNPVEFSSHLTPETLARKLREARDAKQRYGWQHPAVDDKLWNLHAEEITVTPKSETVILGPRFAKFSSEPVQATEIGHKDLTVEIKGQNDIEALCLLLHNRVFTPRPTFLVIGLDDNQIESLELRYDVGFIKVGEKQYTTI